MRKLLIAANWKMNMYHRDAVELIRGIIEQTRLFISVDLMVAPPFTLLETVKDEIQNAHIQLGSQNVFFQESGAYTGEISPGMLLDAGCRYVIIGHSERRQYFHETDEIINKKILVTLKNHLIPILCIGETWEERKQGKTFMTLNQQILFGLQGIDNDKLSSLVVAYEPVWAIGSGKSATKEQVQEVHSYLREVLKEFTSSPELANQFRLLYGGSMNSKNAQEILSQKDVDGGLIGGASLSIDSFCSLVQIAESVQKTKEQQ